MDRNSIVAAQRDALWVIALRTKLLRVQCDKQLDEARRFARDARDTVARARMLQRRSWARNGAGRRRKVVALVRPPEARRA